ncbi:MAG: type II toxin-antitoxin system VapC family toxin [Alphaproteobacteria bacterium]
MPYFDTSFIVPLILPESTSADITRFLARFTDEQLAISHWTQVEFSSVLAREVRMGKMDAGAADSATARFDAIIAESFNVLLPGAEAFDLARKYIARHEAGLRGGDALHLAIARTYRATAIYSLDRVLIKAGPLFGLPVSMGIDLDR